jgi:CheY-like chemotaxis protein
MLHRPPLTVLVADGDQQAVRLIRLVLERTRGWAVLGAGTGAEALDLAEAGGPDVALVAPRLRDVAGTELATRLRRCARAGVDDLPLAFLARRDEDVPAAPVIRKPIDVVTLPQQVAHVAFGQPDGSSIASTGAADVPPTGELREMWIEALPGTLVLVRQVVEAVDLRCQGVRVDASQLSAAATSAHTLSSLAGSFGLRELSRLARELHVLLERDDVGDDLAPDQRRQLLELAREVRNRVLATRPARGLAPPPQRPKANGSSR